MPPASAEPPRLRRLLAVLVVLGTLVTCLVACSSADEQATPASRAQLTTLLRAHGAAVRAKDFAAFLRDVAPGAYRTRQRTVFANLAQVPLSTWSYSLGPAVDADSQKQVRSTYGSSARIVRVELSYAIRGSDVVPAERDLWWTVIVRDGRAQIVNDTDLATAGGVSWRGPWDFGELTVLRGDHGLVLGHPSVASLLPGIVSALDLAVPTVTSVWGTSWARQVTVIVPASDAESAAVLGEAATVSGTAEVGAIAHNDGQDPLTGMVLEPRVVVVADEWSRFTAVGRRIVLTHEITHVASAAATTDATPRWLIEGLAEYVGNLGTGQSVRTAAAELAAVVRRSGAPRALPTDDTFESATTAAQAYQSAWLACRLIATQIGAGGLVRFYRTVGASSLAPDAAAAAAVTRLLGRSMPAFVSTWRDYVQEQLG